MKWMALTITTQEHPHPREVTYGGYARVPYAGPGNRHTFPQVLEEGDIGVTGIAIADAETGGTLLEGGAVSPPIWLGAGTIPCILEKMK